MNKDQKFTTPKDNNDIFLWGYGYLSYYSNEELQELIEELNRNIDSYRKDLTTADYGAYGQGRELIRSTEQSIRTLKYVLSQR